MAYSFARVSTAVAMRVEDYFATGKRWWVRLHEKGGKRHEMPAHHKLEAYLDAYLHAAGIAGAKKTRRHSASSALRRPFAARPTARSLRRMASL